MSKDIPRPNTHLSAEHRKKVQKLKKISRHPAFTVPLITLSLLALVTGVVFLLFGRGTPQLQSSETHTVIITDGGKEQNLPTRARTVGGVLARAGIVLNDGDVVEPAKDTEIATDNFRINVYRAVPVTIVDGNTKTFTYSAATTPRSIVKQAGIEVYPEDRLELLPTENFLTEGSIGERVVIYRSTPVNVNIYGTQVAMRTLSKTVGELLKERGFQLQPGDTVVPVPTTPITTNMQIFLLHKGITIQTVEEEIPMPRQIIEDSSLSFGTSAIRQQGSAGKKLITFQMNANTGEKTIIQEVITVQPVTEITARGKAVSIPSDKQAVMASAGISSGDYAYVDYIVSHESGWCPTKLQGQVGYCPPYAPEVIPAGLGYGLGQATPGSKMSAFGEDWKTNPVTQLRWATSYANGRFGGWAGAYAYWQTHHNW